MKHIQKKFLFQDLYENVEFENNPDYTWLDINKMDNELLKKAENNSNIIIETTENEKIYACIYNHNGKRLTVPMPDFTLVYYDFAYGLNILRKSTKNEIFDKLSSIETFSELSHTIIYNFYGYSSSCIINLFTAIESFINSLLPGDKKFERILNNKTEIFNREQIQEQLSFYVKLKEVLPQFYGKNFFKQSTQATTHINNLKELRDKIIHTKSDNIGKVQSDLFKSLMRFKYDETFLAVKTLINFYKEDYIVDCSCENDF